jgi:hypothetical protein
MFSLLKLHVVNLTGGLSPFESEFIRELHSFGHFFVSVLRQGISNYSRIVSDSDKALKFRLLLLHNCGGSSFYALIFAVDVLIINHWSIHVVFIIYFISAEDGFLIGYPENLPVTPFVSLAEGTANTLKPSIQRSIVELNAVVCFGFKFI